MTTEKSLFKGCPAPGPVPKGHIRLYSMRFCPFAQRTRLVLSAKGIKCDTVNIHLKDKPEWFLEKNPFGTVPVLETSSGQVIYESPITCDYLDEVYADRKLIPADPYEKAQQKMTLELFSKIIPYFYKIPAEKRNGKDILQLEAELNDNLAKLNKTLASKKSKFFGGDLVTMIDYMIWPWFERLEAYGVKHCVEKTPEMKKWIACMLEDRAVKETMHSPDAHKAFFKSYTDGKPNYDYGL